MRFLLGLIFVFALAVPATVTQAQKLPSAKDVGNIIFKEVEKRAIEEFFGKKAAEKTTSGKGKKAKKGKGKGRGKGRGRGQGRGRGGGLPPGLQKQLERNGTLPPGLAKRELPPGLQSKLGDAPPGTERVIAGDAVVLLEKATGKILDVITDVLKGH